LFQQTGKSVAWGDNIFICTGLYQTAAMTTPTGAILSTPYGRRRSGESDPQTLEVGDALIGKTDDAEKEEKEEEFSYLIYPMPSCSHGP